MARAKASKKESSGAGRRTPGGGVELARSLAARVRTCGRLFMRELEPQIVRHGISIGMWFFLRALWDEDGMSQSELSDRAGVMGQTAVPVMKEMERMGFIERKASVMDRRKVHVFLTRRGRDLRADLMPIASAVIDKGTKGISRAEIAAFDKTLDAILANLQAKD